MNNGDFIPPEDLNFHYNREDRLKQLSPETYRQLYEPRKKVIINKRLLIVLIDILLIVVALITITAYRSSMGRAKGVAGCDLELTGFVYDGTGFLSLKLTVKGKNKRSGLKTQDKRRCYAVCHRGPEPVKTGACKSHR